MYVQSRLIANELTMSTNPFAHHLFFEVDVFSLMVSFESLLSLLVIEAFIGVRECYTVTLRIPVLSVTLYIKCWYLDSIPVLQQRAVMGALCIRLESRRSSEVSM